VYCLRGYTLVEIVVVLAIVAVVTAVVLPSMLDRPVSAALRSADDVAGIVRAARRAALDRAVPVIVTLAPTTRAYLVETDADDSSTVLAQGVLALAPGARLAAGGAAARIVFDRLGTASPDSVTVIDDDGSVMVTVDRWTGEVDVRPAAR
jgi:prepilin-type N-terminal cleavage/methylation domain-containing protein